MLCIWVSAFQPLWKQGSTRTQSKENPSKIRQVGETGDVTCCVQPDLPKVSWDRIFYRWVICFHLESCPSDLNVGERSCSQPAKCVTLATVWTTRPEMVLSHACTREPCLHWPLLQLAKPYKSLTLHLQFRKQPVLGPSNLGCTKLQFGKA